MPSIVNRCKQVISAESDDFFRDDTILYYVNKSKRRVVSYLTQQELRPTVRVGDQFVEGAKRSLRGLDKLRAKNTFTFDAASFTEEDNYWSGTADFPADLSQVLYLRYDKKTVMRELNSQNLYMLEWGNLLPTIYESYYYVNNSTGNIFDVYLAEDGSSKDLDIFYIKNPSAVLLADETFDDLPEQLENAVIYGAAMMMIGQESVKDPEGNVNAIMTIYNQELEQSTF